MLMYVKLLYVVHVIVAILLFIFGNCNIIDAADTISLMVPVWCCFVLEYVLGTMQYNIISRVTVVVGI